MCKVEINVFVFILEGVITKYTGMYVKKYSIHIQIQAYFKNIVFIKTLESLSSDFRKGLKEVCKKKGFERYSIYNNRKERRNW
ncbi:hypothetical protein NUSPORA_01680 [Nucleospora cyclopteri]